MRALVLSDARRLELRDVACPELREHEVRVRTLAVGLCGTDLNIFAGAANYNVDREGRPIPLTEEPQILGHEIAGVIEEVGARVYDLRVGERVIVDQGRTCVGEGRSPRCEYCMTGDSHQCEFYREHGITGLPGGFAESVAVPALNALRIESNLETTAAVLTEPLGCVVHSMDRVARADARYRLGTGNGQRVRSVVICGAGPSGLLFVQYLRSVIGFDGLLLMVDRNANKRALAERFGAQSIDPNETDLAAEVLERTQGRRAELLVEATGAGAVFATIARLVRKQATLVLYGHGHTGVDLSVLNPLQFLEPTLVSPVGASGGYEPDGRPSTYVRALRLIENSTIEVERLITHRYTSLADLPRAFEGENNAPDYIKAVLVHGDDGPRTARVH